MQLVISDINLVAHVDSKAFGEVLEVDVAVLVGIKDVLHERGDFVLSHIDFIGEQVSLEVFVRNETISVLIEFTEHMVHLVLSIENSVFNLSHDSA